MLGIHFGHFKAHTLHNLLAEVDATLRSIAYTTGYSYKRWHKGLDVQLLKRIQVWLADKMPTILLLEADLNMNKAIGADAMWMGDLHQWFKTNAGSRSKFKCTTDLQQYLGQTGESCPYVK